MTLEVIIGPMFSGKTSELIRLVEREVYAKRKGAIFKPSFDRRYSARQVASHNGLRYNAFSIMATKAGVRRIPELVAKEELDVVGVDEVQFFPDDLVPLLDSMAYDKKVIACGLNMDFKAEPFLSTMELAARADRVRYLSAVCVICGGEATRTQRLVGGRPAPSDSPVIVVGGKELYQPRCRTCYEPAQ